MSDYQTIPTPTSTVDAPLGPIGRVMARLADAASSPRRGVRLWIALAVIGSQVAVAALVRLSGGTQFSALHLMYLTIAAGGFLRGATGGLVAGVTAGLLLGPFMPLNVAAGLAQPPSTWLFRTALFCLNGLIVGAAASLMRVRLARSERLQASLSQTYSRNLRLFAGLVAQRDEVTAGHCDRVALNAVAIGSRMGMREPELRELYWSALLHDLGKIGVPEAILQKPGRLTEEEFAVMRQHARFGRDVLLSVSDAFGQIASGVYTHHERWDGTGYPRRLAGSEIPLFGRIIAVADVFEAVTSTRPYRQPMELAEALRLVEQGGGTHFDPEVVRAFQSAFVDGAIQRQTEHVPLHDASVPLAVRLRTDDGFEAPGRH